MDDTQKPLISSTTFPSIENPRATEQPAFFYERRQRLAANRRIPTTRREHLLQALAIAVADELELRQEVDQVINAEYAAADNAQQAAKEAAIQAEADTKNPIIAAFNKAHEAEAHDRWETRTSRERRIFRWALEQGILPAGTKETPDTETQYLLLARWKRSLNNTRSAGTAL
jgi:hypothetical protein